MHADLYNLALIRKFTMSTVNAFEITQLRQNTCIYIGCTHCNSGTCLCDHRNSVMVEFSVHFYISLTTKLSLWLPNFSTDQTFLSLSLTAQFQYWSKFPSAILNCTHLVLVFYLLLRSLSMRLHNFSTGPSFSPIYFIIISLFNSNRAFPSISYKKWKTRLITLKAQH